MKHALFTLCLLFSPALALGGTNGLSCAKALAEKGRLAGPDLGKRVGSLVRLGFIHPPAKAFLLGEGAMARSYRVQRNGTEAILKYFHLRASLYPDLGYHGNEIPEKRAECFEEDILGFEVFSQILPQAASEEKFGASRVLEVSRENYYLVLSDTKGQVLHKVIKALGTEHPVTIRLDALYRRRLDQFESSLLVHPEVSKVDRRGKHFPQLTFSYQGIGYIVDAYSIIVDTETHLMTVFDPI